MPARRPGALPDRAAASRSLATRLAGAAALAGLAMLPACGGAPPGPLPPAGARPPAPRAAAAQAPIDVPATLDRPHRAFGVTAQRQAVEAYYAALSRGTRRLMANSPLLGCCGPTDGLTTPDLVGENPTGRALGGVAAFTGLTPNTYTIGADALAYTGLQDPATCVGVLGWRFDDWTDDLADFRTPAGALDAISTRTRTRARTVGSAAFEDAGGMLRFDLAKGPAWARFGGYPQRWTVTIWSVGASGRASDRTYATGTANGALPGGFLVARAEFDRPFREVIWGGLVTEGVNAGKAAPPGRYVALIEPASPATSPTADTDADGVPDARDAFPQDAGLAFQADYPIGSEAWYAFEDLYPQRGDADYNDFVVSYQASQRFDAAERLKSVEITLEARARGAGYDHALLTDWRGAFAGGAAWQVQELSPAGAVVRQATGQTEAGPVTIFASSRAALPPPSGDWATNAQPGKVFVAGRRARVTLTLATPGANLMGQVPAPPYKLYCRVANTNQTIYLPQVDANGDGVTDAALVDGQVRPMIDSAGYPWALEVPVEWRWPLEGVRLELAYPRLDDWVAAGRADARDWYLHPLPPVPVGAQPSSPLGDPDGDGFQDFLFARTLFR